MGDIPDLTKTTAAPEAPTHPREGLDLYGQDLDPDGDWAYNVDDYGVTYVGGQWYPFDRTVRLSPDCEFRSWRNQYVSVGPTDEPTVAVARLHLTVRKQGHALMTVHVRAGLNMETGEITFSHDDLDDRLLHEAQVKGARVLALLAAERLRHSTPPHPPCPVTAHERYNAAQAVERGALW